MLCKVIFLAGLSYFSPIKPDGDDPIDTLSIEGIVVNSKLQRFSTALSLKVIPISEIKVSKQLVMADMLNNFSNISINNYGPGGVSSATLRGLGTYHTAILWNGINLQNSMHGGVNLSNIPINFIDQLAIQYGGNGALFGSGAIGGTIQIDNTLELGRGHSAEFYQTYGSYNAYFTGLNYTYSGLKFASSTRVFYSETDNNYRFHNTTRIGKPYERQVNSNWSKMGLMQNFVFQLSKHNKLSSSTWTQNAFNRYAPMMTAYTNNEKDYNNFFRSVIQWSSTHEKVDFNTKASILYDAQKYRNPGFDTSNHYSTSTILESEAIFKLNQEHRFEIGFNMNKESVTSTNYASKKERTRPAFAFTYRYTNDNGKYEFYSGIREEMIGSNTNPITWAIGSRVRISQTLFLRGNISKNYRIPVMNDLYWYGSYMTQGNPKLKPEEGYSEELGIDYILTNNTFSIISKLSAFNNNVSQWIVWVQNDTIWTPSNIKKVWARGIDFSLGIEKNYQKWHWGLELMGTGTLSTTEKSSDESEISKQLPYVPKLKVNCSIILGYNSFLVKYNHIFTGKRYTTPSNAEYVDPYLVATLSIEKNFEGKSHLIKTFFRIDNVWNEEYQIRKYYPMPLRNYQIGVSILINKPIH